MEKFAEELNPQGDSRGFSATISDRKTTKK